MTEKINELDIKLQRKEKRTNGMTNEELKKLQMEIQQQEWEEEQKKRFQGRNDFEGYDKERKALLKRVIEKRAQQEKREEKLRGLDFHHKMERLIEAKKEMHQALPLEELVHRVREEKIENFLPKRQK